jgi:ABC-type branched-subunit amino acid transport system substrate-binding protein
MTVRALVCMAEPLSPVWSHLMRSRHTAILAAFALVTALTACSAKSQPAAPPPIALFGTDGNTADDFGKGVIAPADLIGMAGTAPLTPLTTAFKDRIKAVDHTVTDFDYAGETYDAVVITALATQLAGTTNPKVVATYINGVTTTARGGGTCETVADCFARIKAHQDVAYRGISLRSGFTDKGEPSTATYGTKRFDANDKIDAAKTEFVITGDPTTATTAKTPTPALSSDSGGPMKIGVLLPASGGLALLGRPMFAAARLAVADINGAGGVLGAPVVAEYGDDGTSVEKSITGAMKMINDGVGTVIGPATSGGTLQTIPLFVKAGVISFSPSATSAALTDVSDSGLFFRTAPSDNLQAQALANIIMRTGAQKVFIIARDDAYGTGLEQTVSAALATAGVGGDSIRTAEYSTADNVDNSKAYARIAASVKQFQPNAVLLIGYSETANVIAAMDQVGVTYRS